MAHEQGLTVLMITHKFREVMSYSDDVTILRKGEYVGSCSVAETSPTQLSEMMMGEKVAAKPLERTDASDTTKPDFLIKNFSVLNDQGLTAVRDLSLSIRAGEIVGIAGISGNGQTELVAGLSGQRAIHKGELRVGDQMFSPTRKNLQQHSVFVLPEEPLKNACVPQMTVAENMALRNYDLAPLRNGLSMLNFGKLKKQAEEFIEQFNVKTPSTFEPIGNLSGGNVQRAVLARELSNDVNVLIVANPCFGLDFNSVAFIRQKIMEARNSGAAVLLVSEDLDEIMQLSDRFYVMSNGELLMESTPETASIVDIGHAMAGHTEVQIDGDAYDQAS
jgi:simple sugar transport system ATP-binding protein